MLEFDIFQAATKGSKSHTLYSWFIGTPALHVPVRKCSNVPEIMEFQSEAWNSWFLSACDIHDCHGTKVSASVEQWLKNHPTWFQDCSYYSFEIKNKIWLLGPFLRSYYKMCCNRLVYTKVDQVKFLHNVVVVQNMMKVQTSTCTCTYVQQWVFMYHFQVHTTSSRLHDRCH